MQAIKILHSHGIATPQVLRYIEKVLIYSIDRQCIVQLKQFLLFNYLFICIIQQRLHAVRYVIFGICPCNAPGAISCQFTPQMITISKNIF